MRVHSGLLRHHKYMLYNALYNFPSLVSQPPGWPVSAIFSLPGQRVLRASGNLLSVLTCMCAVRLAEDLAISRPTMADTCFQGGTKPSDRILSSFILDSILVCWVMSWFLGSKDFTSCLEINLNASRLFRGETF